MDIQLTSTELPASGSSTGTNINLIATSEPNTVTIQEIESVSHHPQVSEIERSASEISASEIIFESLNRFRSVDASQPEAEILAQNRSQEIAIGKRAIRIGSSSSQVPIENPETQVEMYRPVRGEMVNMSAFEAALADAGPATLAECVTNTVAEEIQQVYLGPTNALNLINLTMRDVRLSCSNESSKLKDLENLRNLHNKFSWLRPVKNLLNGISRISKILKVKPMSQIIETRPIKMIRGVSNVLVPFLDRGANLYNSNSNIATQNLKQLVILLNPAVQAEVQNEGLPLRTFLARQREIQMVQTEDAISALEYNLYKRESLELYYKIIHKLYQLTCIQKLDPITLWNTIVDFTREELNLNPEKDQTQSQFPELNILLKVKKSQIPMTEILKTEAYFQELKQVIFGFNQETLHR